jgi:hypothetical protein
LQTSSTWNNSTGLVYGLLARLNAPAWVIDTFAWVVFAYPQIANKRKTKDFKANPKPILFGGVKKIFVCHHFCMYKHNALRYIVYIGAIDNGSNKQQHNANGDERPSDFREPLRRER